MRNDIFDFGRYWMYQKRVFRYFRMPLAVYGALLGLTGILALTGCSDMPLFIVVFLGAIVLPSIICWDHGSILQSCADIMLPASSLEKYLSRVALLYILPVGVFVAVSQMNVAWADFAGHIVLFDTFLMILGSHYKRGIVSLIALSAAIATFVKKNPELLDCCGNQLMYLASAVLLVAGWLMYRRMSPLTKKQAEDIKYTV